MNIKEETWIEQFFDQELSEDNLEQFHQRLKTDATFKQRVKLFAEAHETIYHLFFPKQTEERAKLKAQLFEVSEVHSSPPSNHRLTVLYPYLKIAAAFILSLGLAYLAYQFLPFHTQQVNPYQMATNMVRLDALDATASERGQSQTTALSNIVQAYQNKDYEQVIQLSSALQIPSTSNIYFDVLLLKGIAAYHLNQSQKALDAFQKIINSANGQEDSALWWQVVIYLEQDTSKAKTALQTIINREYTTAAQARLLMGDLE